LPVPPQEKEGGPVQATFANAWGMMNLLGNG
jgi:hypothetical protein